MPRGGPDYSAITVRGIIGRFFRRMEEAMAVSVVSKIGLMVDSDQETETYKLLGMVPVLRQWKGGRLLRALRTDGFTITNLLFEATLPVDVDDLRRDKTGQLAIRMGEVGKRTGTHWLKLVTEAIENNGLCYDGQNFFDTDHSLGDSGTQINSLAAAQAPSLNVTTPTNPTSDEFEDIIAELVGYMWGYKDDQGEPINGDALQFCLMVPAFMAANARKAVRALLSNSGSTALMQTQDFSVAVVPNPRLTDDDVIYLFRADSEMKPFILQGEIEPRVSYLGPESEHAFKTRQVLYGVESIRNVGYGEPLHAIKAQLS